MITHIKKNMAIDFGNGEPLAIAGSATISNQLYL